MTRQTIDIINEDAWLAERVKDVTSTDVSALFGLSPYRTAFELYHEKASGQPVRIADNPRMRWGRRLEATIAAGVAEDQGWSIARLAVYMRDPEARVGSSFDYRIDSQSDGPGIMEIKNVDGMAYRQRWSEDEAPAHIELQVQHQLLVSGYSWAAIVALVGGNDAKVIYRHRDDDVSAAILAKVAEFWRQVEAATPPPADYTRDADIIARLHATANPGQVYDATGDAEIERLVRQYHEAGRQADELETLRKTYRAQLLERIGAAEKVTAPWGSLATGMVKGTEGKPITADMVGTMLGARTGYRNFRLNLKKETANV